MNPPNSTFAPLFSAVGQALRQHQSDLNAADVYNSNHGDHMVQVFDLAARAVADAPEGSAADQMENAAGLLTTLSDNGSAQVYARGLEAMAAQFRRYNISMDEFLAYVRKVLAEDSDAGASQAVTGGSGDGDSVPGGPPSRSGDLLKALMAGLAAWGDSESGRPVKDSPLDMGALFELGMAYMQAKQRGGSRVEILADAAASASPPGKLPHRYQSGKLAIQALLEAIQAGS